MLVPDAFRDRAGQLRCPHCHAGLQLAGQSLRCDHGHSYDLAARGYLNLVQQRKGAATYEKDSFTHRRAFVRLGYYDHILEGVVQALEGRMPATILDAGCGEGSLTGRVREALACNVWGLDYAKDAIYQAAADKGVGWLVGDLANLPFRDHSVNAVLNLFAPANYAEFARVLAPGGLLYKVIPGPEHLRELRQLAGLPPKDEAGDEGLVHSHFEKHFQLVEEAALSSTLPLTEEAAHHLIHMTPLLFGRDTGALPVAELTHITIDGRLLVGRPPETE